MNAAEIRNVVSRLTGMILDLDGFGIELRRSGASAEASRQLLLGLHTEFRMLDIQLQSDRVRRLRAENIGNGVTRLLACLARGEEVNLDRELGEIQTELMTLQMVLDRDLVTAA